MKTTYWIAIVLGLMIFSCKKENRWEKEELKQETVKLKFTDLSQQFFDLNNPLASLQMKYPFFFDNSTPNDVWEAQRTDSLELAVYNSTQKTFADQKYKNELERLFAYYKSYFPKELTPEVFTYSSGLLNLQEPVLFGRKEGMLFIALDGFLGADSKWYKEARVYPYQSKNMNPENLVPTVVQAIGREIVPFDPRQQTFIDLMVTEGKKMMLADALIPNSTDELKMGYTKEELAWAVANEGQIWNYFVEQNLIFNSDQSNRERFLNPGPYSKFQNEIETQSPGRIGVWMGWQICRKYMNENQDVSLEKFIQTDPQLIFKESNYKPKKTGSPMSSEQSAVNDEVDASIEQ